MKKSIYKKSFSLIELIFIITVISIVSLQFFPKNFHSSLNQAANKLIIHLKNTKYQAMLDNKFDHEDEFWFRKRWTMKFQKCSKTIGGLYYVIYSDTNKGGHVNKEETLKDPLSQKWLYSNYDCNASFDESEDILLTKEYGVVDVNVSCNNTSTIGQISFGHDGRVYTKLGSNSTDTYKNELKEKCYITLYDNKQNNVSIIIEPNTGFIYKK